MHRPVRSLRIHSKADEGGKCIRWNDENLHFSEMERGKVWKNYMEGITNKENGWDHNVEGDAEDGPVVCVNREEVLQAYSEVKRGKAPVHSEVSLELIAASGGVGIQVMAEIPHRWIWNATQMYSNNSASNLLWEW